MDRDRDQIEAAPQTFIFYFNGFFYLKKIKWTSTSHISFQL